MWWLFTLPSEPAGESNTTCIGLLQHGPGEVSQTYSTLVLFFSFVVERKLFTASATASACHDLSGRATEKFCTPSVVKMANGFRQKWRYSNSRGSGQTTSLCSPVIEQELELEVRQRLDTLTCFNYHHLSSDFLILPCHHCNSMFFFQL